MGTWGFKVGEDDVFCDVYDFFFKAYNQGKNPEEASKSVLQVMSDYFSDCDDRYEAYFALAFAQWETQHKDNVVFEEVKRFISTGECLENWAGNGTEEGLLKKRRNALLVFLRKISKPRPSKKRRVHKTPEFIEIALVDLIAPDKRKSLKIQESYIDGKFTYTVATVMWKTGGGSIFHSTRSDLKIAAEWIDPQNLQICFLNAIESEIALGFGKAKETFYCGDRVKLIYKFTDSCASY